MALDPQRILSAFRAAAEQSDLADRAAVLDRECQGDVNLRHRVEALLQTLDGPPDLTIAGPAVKTLLHATEPGTENLARVRAEPPLGVTLDQPPLPHEQLTSESTFFTPQVRSQEGPGTRIGPYKLLQQIGEGGMGSVYMAEQVEPVRRRVALKIIKPGMDSAQVIARFEAERQALALMDHQNIARVLDAGTTDSGRPFFVMELVHGVPMTQYCDEAQLTLGERLELFIPVCQAIQHAHQKGIIHRDIKPSNVLVTLYDGKPVPKVIDFGVAKAVDQQLTDRTMFTQFGSIVGTLEYMSPEQAEMSALGVDTRSDIYSLGVLLYELLTGSTPLERSRVRETSYAAILKRIKEEEPPRPSTRLSSSGEQLRALSAQRKTEPARLMRSMRGELDWIVMKALEKDRTRRYETASAFASDIARFLKDEPVEACPPSASYRLQKFARRYRAVLVTVASFATLLFVGAILSTWQAFRATRAEHRAMTEARRAIVAEEHSRRERDRALAAEAQAETEGEKARRAAAEARAVLSFLQDQVLAAARPEGQEGGLGKDVTLRAAVDAAEAKIGSSFAGQHAVEADIRATLGNTYIYLGEPALAVKQLQRSLALRLANLGPNHPDTLATQDALGLAYQANGRLDQAIPLLEQTLQSRSRVLAADDPTILATQNSLALAYQANGRLDRAIPLFEQTLQARSVNLGRDHPDTLASRNNLALAYQAAGRWDLAVPLFEQTLKVRTLTLGRDHPDTLASQNSLALAYQADGRVDLAIPLLEKVLAVEIVKLGPGHPTTLLSQNTLANSYKSAGRWDRAIALLEQTLATETARLGPEHPTTLASQDNLALALRDAGQWSRAIELFERTLKVERARMGTDHPSTLLTQNDLALTYRDDGQWKRAIDLFEQTLQSRRAKLGTDHPDTLLTQHNLAMAYREAGQWERSIALFEETLAAQKARLGPDHPYTLLTQNNLGPAYVAIGEVDRGIAILEQTLAARTAKLGPKHPSTLSTQNNLALAYQAGGQLDRAIALFESTLSARIAEAGADHPRTFTTQFDLALASNEHGDAARAESMLREVLAARVKKLAADHPDVAQTLFALGRVLLDQQKWAEAEPLLRESLAIWNDRRPDGWSRFDTESRLGEALFRQHKFAEAEPLLLSGYEGLKDREASIAVQKRSRVTAAGERIVQLYEAWQQPDKAEAWRRKIGAPSRKPTSKS